MLEPIMFSALGFLAASLLMVAVAPAIHERAVRLTTRRMQAAMPLSVAEMHVEKDVLRAQFAMSLARLEVAVEAARAKAVEQLSEVGRKSAEIHRLKVELDEAAAFARGLQDRARSHRSVTRRVVKLLLYLFRRARRPSAAAIPAPRPDDAQDWVTIPARFRIHLQKMAHGRA
jgi:hypothetical protein